LSLVLNDEARIRRHSKIGTNVLEQRHHLDAMAFMQRHELDRFRQAENRGEREHDRCDPPDIKQHLPAVARHQRSAGEASERAADRHHAGRDDGERGAPVTRRRFGVNGYHIGNNSADAETGQEAQP
jgi:hypothetical protein